MKASTKKSTGTAAKARAKAKPATANTTAAPATPTPKAWLRDPRNPYRLGSAYGVCFDILAAHGEAGMTRERLVELLAAATGKDERGRKGVTHQSRQAKSMEGGSDRR